jgi:hypothetical protein
MWACLVLAILHGAPAPDLPDAETSPRPSYTIALQDWLLNIRARKALCEDRDLRRFNLVVVIDRGVASLYGPVPSLYFQERAECLMMQLKGVLFVHNHLRIEDDGIRAELRSRQFPPIDERPAILPGRD